MLRLTTSFSPLERSTTIEGSYEARNEVSPSTPEARVSAAHGSAPCVPSDSRQTRRLLD